MTKLRAQLSSAVRCTLASALLLLATPVRADSLAPTLLKDELYTESFMVLADLADGTYVQLMLAISNLGAGDNRGGCRILVVQPGHEAWTAEKKVGRKRWSYSSSPVPRLQIEDCSIWTTRNRTEVHTAVNGATVHLTLNAPLKRVDPPYNRVKAGDDTHTLQILIPWAEVQADIVLPDRRPRLLSGFGYSDKFRSTTHPKQLGRWMRFRSLHGKNSLLLLARFPVQNANVRAWIWRRGTSRPVAVSSVETIEVKEGWIVNVTSGDQLLRITSKELLFRSAPVEELGPLGYLVRPIIGNPITRTYRAQLSDGEKSTVGILEISHVD